MIGGFTIDCEEKIIMMLKRHPTHFSRIVNPTERMQITAVTAWPSNICEIKDPSEVVQLAAVTPHPSMIFHIKQPYPSVCMVAVKQHGILLEYVPPNCQTVEVISEAIKENPKAIQYIKIPLTDEQKAEIMLLSNIFK